MNKLKIGVLGGTRGLDFLTRVLLNHPFAEVTAICENNEKLKEKIIEEAKNLSANISVFSEYDEFLDSGIEAVIIANFANAHAPFAIKALNKGLNVFSENLPTQTMKEAVLLSEAVEKSGKIYAYGENYCYLPHILEMRRLFETGEFGRVMHMEGNFINDCSFRWHLLTRGNRNHWRNLVPSTFYCTHSIGPMLYVSSERAESVVGMETQRMDYMAEVGARSGSAAMEIMQLHGGGMAKSINGNYRRDYAAEYRFICENGTIESDVYNFGNIRIFRAGTEAINYTADILRPPYSFDHFPIYSIRDLSTMTLFEIADVYLINTFIQSCLGNEEAKKYMIDIYRALDMSTIGLLAYRSILSGGSAMKVPNLRNKEDRDIWRNDNKSTDPAVSLGDDLLPTCRSGFVDVSNEVYESVQKKFESVPLTSGSH